MQDIGELTEVLKQGMAEVSQTSDPIKINTIVEGFLKKLFSSEYVTLLLLDKQTNVLYCEKGDKSLSLSMVDAPGLLGNCFLTKQSAIYNHIRSEKLYTPNIDNPHDEKLKSQIIYPLTEDENLLAVLQMSRSIKLSQNYTNNDLSTLKSIEPYLFKLVHTLFKDDEKSMVEINQHEINQKLHEAERILKDQNTKLNDTMLFLANTVHDIRTPANSLFGFLELIEEKVKDQRLLEFITNAKESAAFINTLTDSILERVKHENDVSVVQETNVNSIQFFASMAEVFTGNMTNKKINYLIDIDPRMPKTIRLDATKLKRVLINLIGNAYKFTPALGTIRFKTEYIQDKQRMKFSIVDTGLGIPKERQQEIFKAFEQADESTSVHFGGTGLGLAISAQYVEELGGSLELESEVERGSTFYFDIPVSVDDPATPYPFLSYDKHVVIYTKDTTSVHAKLIKEYLVKFRIPENRILILDEIPVSTTHLICSEETLDSSVVSLCEEKNMKLLILENELLSISENSEYAKFPVITKNTYLGDMLYGLASCRRKPRVLIIDDNKINIKLLESILEGEFCDLYYELEGNKGLNRLHSALEEQNPYDIVFLDKHMPDMTGTELLERYREIEKKHPYAKIYAVSITGDVQVNETEKALFDSFVHKPFKNSQIREICARHGMEIA